jgi:hypothetical protein
MSNSGRTLWIRMSTGVLRFVEAVSIENRGFDIKKAFELLVLANHDGHPMPL